MAEKILIVDDDLETLRLVGLMLQKQGYEIVAANNGAQALSMAASERPDLILLDIMMPDIDGIEVARRLRVEPSTAMTPILMFTAKTQVDDKVAGYEAGADDYLTKPTHPAELSAHVKLLLSRAARPAKAAPTPVERGYILAVMAAKGGSGSSTVALNLAVAMAQKGKTGITVMELQPGRGTWGLELGFNKTEGLNNLLKKKASELTNDDVLGELTSIPQGVRLLMAGHMIKDQSLAQNVAAVEAIVGQLALIAPLTIIDIGDNFFPGIERVLALCNEALVVIEPHPINLLRTKALIEDLREQGFGKSRLMTLVQNNRVRSDVQLSWSQVQDSLELPVQQVISSAPEMAYQGALRNLPMVLVPPENLITQQYGKLAEFYIQRLRKP